MGDLEDFVSDSTGVMESVLGVLMQHGMSEKQGRDAIFDMQRNGVVFLFSDFMMQIANSSTNE